MFVQMVLLKPRSQERLYTKTKRTHLQIITLMTQLHLSWHLLWFTQRKLLIVKTIWVSESIDLLLKRGTGKPGWSSKFYSCWLYGSSVVRKYRHLDYSSTPSRPGSERLEYEGMVPRNLLGWIRTNTPFSIKIYVYKQKNENKCITSFNLGTTGIT